MTKHRSLEIALRERDRARALWAARRPLQPQDMCTGSDRDGVVSLTTFPARVNRVHLAIRSILKGEKRPGSIILNLAEDEFPGREIPGQVASLKGRGLKIQWVSRNTRSYKKLNPTLRALPNSVIVTADDDVYYPSSWLQGLWRAHESDNRAILGYRGTEMVRHGQALAPYLTWPPARPTTGSQRTFLTGMGGILYPPGSLPAIALDEDLAISLCPTADDVWFKAMSLLVGTRVTRIVSGSEEFPSVHASQRVGLFRTNVHQGRNDAQVSNVFDHFDLWSHLDPRTTT